jgi:hypothetical protein
VALCLTNRGTNVRTVVLSAKCSGVVLSTAQPELVGSTTPTTCVTVQSVLHPVALLFLVVNNFLGGQSEKFGNGTMMVSFFVPHFRSALSFALTLRPLPNGH